MLQELESASNKDYIMAQKSGEEENTLFWNVYASVYDGINHSFPYRKLLWDTLAVLELQPGNILLDAGCGTGNFEMFLLEKRAPLIKIDAVDSSPAMISRAKTKLKGCDFVELSRIDLNQKLSFADASFDRIVCINVLYSLKDLEFTLNELSRVLKPEGKLVLSTPKAGAKVGPIVLEQFQRIGNVRGVFRKAISLFKTFGMISSSALGPILISAFFIRKRAKKRIYHFVSEDQLWTLFDTSGLERLKVDLSYGGQNWLIVGSKASDASN